MEKRKTKHGALLTTIFSIISVVYMFPILLVLMNSFKKKAYISRKPFAVPTGKMYVGLDNYFRGVKQANFFEGAKWSGHHRWSCIPDSSVYLPCAPGILFV